MKGLGHFFRGCLQGTFEPHFVLEEIGNPTQGTQKIPIGEEIISQMYMRGIFKMEDLRVAVSKDISAFQISLCVQPKAYSLSCTAFLPISGFPRQLIIEDNEIQGRNSHMQSLCCSASEIPKHEST